jgi:hypothetical protein
MAMLGYFTASQVIRLANGEEPRHHYSFKKVDVPIALQPQRGENYVINSCANSRYSNQFSSLLCI